VRAQFAAEQFQARIAPNNAMTLSRIDWLWPLKPQKHSSRCDPALIKAIARGRAWFEELATGRARSLQELAKRDGISRRYIRRLVGLAFLSPELVEAILLGRQPVELTATRLTELDLSLDWTEQQKLLAG
jgi:ParB-like chromosome segregation protein Spo0J